MTTFSPFDQAPIDAAEAWFIAHSPHAAALAVAMVLGAFWLVGAALLIMEGKIFRGVLSVITLATAVAVGTQTSGAALLKQLEVVGDAFSIGEIPATDSFFDAAKQFPLAARMDSDFGSTLPPDLAENVAEFTTECIAPKAFKNLQARKEADAVTDIEGRKIKWGASDATCKKINEEIATAVLAWKGTRSSYAAQLAVAREMVRALAVSSESPPIPIPVELQHLLIGKTPITDRLDVATVGKLQGDVAAGLVKSFTLVPALVLLPGGLWNLGLYGAAFVLFRRASTFTAYGLHQEEETCIRNVDGKDTDTQIDPLHVFSAFVVTGSSTARAYRKEYERCVTNKWTDVALGAVRLVFSMGLVIAGWLVVNWKKAGGIYG